MGTCGCCAPLLFAGIISIFYSTGIHITHAPHRHVRTYVTSASSKRGGTVQGIPVSTYTVTATISCLCGPITSPVVTSRTTS